jgi:NTE family protein
VISVADPREIARRARRIGDRAATARSASLLSDPGTLLPGGEPRGHRDPMTAFRESGPVDPRRRPTGLVLAGGGAKGAYHAGALKYLAEQDTQIVGVAGASVGALNGALVAAEPTLYDAARKVRQVWLETATETGPPAYGDGDLLTESLGDRVLNLPGRLTGPMLRPGYLDRLIEKHLDPAALRNGLPLFIAVFRSGDPVFPSLNPFDYLKQQDWDGPTRGLPGRRLGVLGDLVLSKAGVKKSDWLLANDLPKERMFNAILASAAIPVVMPPRNVDGTSMRDGGVLGGGNVPVGALEGRISRVIAIHLEALPLFHAGRFSEMDVIEIIPSTPLAPAGLLGAASASLDLSPARVDALFELGYADARQTLEAAWAQDAAQQAAAFLDARRADAVRELEEPLGGLDAPPGGSGEPQGRPKELPGGTWE